MFSTRLLSLPLAPEPGGLNRHQINLLFSRLRKERQLVGFDISELSPSKDPGPGGPALI